MPGYDQTGPKGQGPRSGRGLGRCGAKRKAGSNMARNGGRLRGKRGRGFRFFRDNNDELYESTAGSAAQQPMEMSGGRRSMNMPAYDPSVSWVENLGGGRRGRSQN